MENLSDLEKEIVEILRKHKKSLTEKEIKKLLKIENEDELRELKECLDKLRIQGIIYLNDQTGEFTLFQRCKDLAIGTVKYNPKSEIKEAYVVSGSNHIHIPSHCLNGAIKGDLVVVRRDSLQPTFAKVEKILRRDNALMLFDYDIIEKEFIPYNWPTSIKLHIPSSQIKKLTNGTRVQIKLSLDKTNNAYNGQIVSIIGHKDDPDFDIKTIVSNLGITIDFSEDAIKQAEAIPQHVSKEEINKRCQNGGLDLRNETIFTIDGENTKDIDDAISIKMLPNGNYLLGVHIADVSYYIKENTPLDLEARERSTSVYPYNAVIPMLPHCLSNGICSLNPNEDRLALSCLIEIAPDGEIINYEFRDTIINSKMKMSYEKINDIFEQQIIHEDYEPFIEELSLMAELSEILSKRKLERGYICFDDTEVLFEDKDGSIVDIKRRKRGMAEKMIENFMLTANECAASFTHWQDIPAIYRIHPAPNIDKLKEAIALCKLPMSIPTNLDNPRVLQGLIKKIRSFDEYGVYNELILQAMNRASYSPDNCGHYGLALDDYTHYTSPIRRYPDLQTHRNIRITRDLITIDEKDMYEIMAEICEHSSRQERIADRAEKDVELYKMAEYMENHIGEPFIGYITNISHNGVTVKTEEMISGKISIESLKQLGYEYVWEKMKLVNSTDGTELFLGDKLELICISANKENRKIRFELKQKLAKQKVKVS